MRNALFNATIDVNQLDGTNGFAMVGINEPYNTFVSNAGDVNGDGISDILLGVPYFINGSNTSAGYVIFGRHAAFPARLGIDTLDGSDGFKITTAQANSRLGFAVSMVGDINYDGISDMVLSDQAINNFAGAGYVVFGSRTQFPSELNVDTLDGTRGFTVLGAQANGFLGYSAGTAGDVNGDGMDDIILGAPDLGTGYVILGKKTRFPAQFKVDTLNGTNGFSVSGGSWLGYSVNTLGDINGDGIADIALGEQRTGGSTVVYVIFGKKTGFPAHVNIDSLNGSNGFKISSSGDISLGFSVSAAGDVNGDGINDVLLGARGASYNASYPYFEQRAVVMYVVFGKKTAFSPQLSVDMLNGTNGFNISGAAMAAHLELPVPTASAAGDINGDGIGDIIFGALKKVANSGEEMHGVNYVVFGNRTGFPAQFNINTLNGRNGFNITGVPVSLSWSPTVSVSGGGDVNDDGIDDIIVGAQNVNNTGAAYVIFGKFPLLLLNNQLAILQDQAVVINSDNLSAEDLNGASEKLIFNITALNNGRFAYVVKPGSALNTFVQQDVIDEKICFIQEGSKGVSYSVSVTNGVVSTKPASANVTFIRSYPPPELNHPLSEQTVEVNTPFHINIPDNTFVDPVGNFPSNELIYWAKQANGSSLPSWVNFNNKTLFSGKALLISENQFSLFAANPKNTSAVSHTNFTLFITPPNASPTEPIVGGIFGALALLTAAVLFLKYCMKKYFSESQPENRPIADGEQEYFGAFNDEEQQYFGSLNTI